MKNNFWSQSKVDGQIVWVLDYQKDIALHTRQQIFKALKSIIPARIETPGNSQNLHWFDWVSLGYEVQETLKMYRELE